MNLLLNNNITCNVLRADSSNNADTDFSINTNPLANVINIKFISTKTKAYYI